MPIYEYECHDCEKEVSIFFLSFSDAENEEALCPECGSKKLERIVSGVAVLKEKKPVARTPSSGGTAHKAEDTRSLARTMDDAARKSSKGYGDDFKEVKGRLEKGESSTSIEKRMRKRVGESMDTPH
ncbi:MAG: zinc ribbon domain-containing protein [Candidatus Dadabacteria bacterium]